MEAGRAYETAGMPEKAKAAYEKIKEDFPASIESRQIDKYLGRVSQ